MVKEHRTPQRGWEALGAHGQGGAVLLLGLSGLTLQGCHKQEQKLVLAMLLWETTSIFLPGCPSAPLRHRNEYCKRKRETWWELTSDRRGA